MAAGRGGDRNVENDRRGNLLPEDEPVRSPGGGRKPAHGFWPFLRSWPVTRPSGSLRWTCSSAARLAQELGAAGRQRAHGEPDAP